MTSGLPAVCPNCQERNTLTWGTFPKKLAPVADGRLTVRDVSTIFYLGCDCCSETVIAEVDAETVARALTDLDWRPPVAG